MKHPIAIIEQARKIEARNGGSITKKSMNPEANARTLAIVATAMLTERNCFIANGRGCGCAEIALTRARARVYAEGSSD